MLESGQARRRRALFGALALLIAFATVQVGAASARAALPELLTQFPENPARGSGADQLDGLFGLASDPTSGHVYVAEPGNSRISEFDPWGVFVKAWGWGVEDGTTELQVCGPETPEVSPPPDLCRAGIAGPGAGQMDFPNGLVVDAGGDVYVFERNNARVQKFNSAGEFLLMFGGKVNKTTGENVCTKAQLEAGDVCGAGVSGTGDGQFSKPTGFFGSLGDNIDVGADGTIYVGDQNRIQLFEPNGTIKGELPLPDDERFDTLAIDFVEQLAIDPVSGDVYVVYSLKGFPSEDPSILRLDPVTGDLIGSIQVEVPELGTLQALATDAGGGVFASFAPSSNEALRILRFGPNGGELIGYDEEFAALPSQPSENAVLRALDTNSIGNLYTSRANGLLGSDPRSVQAVAAFGPPPIALAPPPKVPPTIGDEFATSVGTTSATVKAKINPRFFDDTKSYVEFGTEDCEASVCQKTPLPPGARLTTQVVNRPLTSAGVVLTGLTPNTTYHYRFVAESGGGGPVLGADRTFTTVAQPPQQPACPANQTFRAGSAAFLPDCRAYEMVSPVDKNGADISVVFNSVGDPASLDQASTDGDALTYSAFRAFGAVESSPYTSQYLARRTAAGWSSDGISPPRRGPSLIASGAGLDSQYKGFSPDLCSGWLLQDSDFSLAEGSIPGTPNLYRRDICAGSYSALAPLVPPNLSNANEFQPELQGVSADGSQAIFIAPGKLTANASTLSQLYEVGLAGLRLVCILPNKSALKGTCTAGTGDAGARRDRGASLSNAISDDGSRIYWTEGLDQGRLFVRVNRTDTFAVSEQKAQFWTAATDGSKALYSVGKQLFQFDLATKASTLIANGFAGLVGASDDLSKFYFASTESLAPGATAGEPNLYLFTTGDPPSFSFVAALAESDVSATNTAPSPVATFPIRHASRVTPDGNTVAFMSSGTPTGYDNTDVASGQADAGVFLYRADSDTLVCVSCNPTGARPAGRDVKDQEHLAVSFWAAALLPPAANQIRFPNVLSDDGTRLFFESFDPLSLRDTNSQLDVYEWEAVGTGNCSEAAPGFHESLGGCVNLISSGDSPQGSELVDASADGRDVFFKTASSLLPQDPGLIDIYDARADGGFPLPEPPPTPCLGEACQNPRPAPNDPTPSSQSFFGPGDEGLSCPKGKHLVVKGGEERCVKNKKRKKKQGSSKSKTRRAHR